MYETVEGEGEMVVRRGRVLSIGDGDGDGWDYIVCDEAMSLSGLGTQKLLLAEADFR